MEILNTYPEIITQWNLVVPCIIAGAFLILCVVVAIKWEESSLVAIGVVGGILIFGIFIGVFSKEVQSGKTIMQVIFDDTISLSEFTNKYEIISQEGKIYTIIEKDIR